MADITTYIGIIPRGIHADSTALARGVRVTRGSNGLFTAQDATARGDMVTISPADANGYCEACKSSEGKVPALASEACAVGDLAYSAAAGKFSKTSASAVLMGRWTQAASGDGVLGEVELFPVA